MKNFFKSAGFKLLAVVAAFLTGIFIYAAVRGDVATLPEQIAGAVLTPLQSLGSALSGGVGGLFSGVTTGGAWQKEKADLESEINDLRDRLVEYDDMKRRYDQLVAFLELKEQNPDYQFADAAVIARDPADKYGGFTVNAGSLKDVKAGDPVIAAEGLVGVVSEVGLNWARVSTILDVQTHVSAYISRSGDAGVTAGSLALAQDGLLRLNNLDRDAGVLPGDVVVTYGGGGQYPAKLKIGAVTEVAADSDGLSAYAVIQPFADVAGVTDVLIITDFGERISETER